jgi:uncharacterized protein
VEYDPIDRITPTRRPDATPLVHQDWEHLLFLHWEVPVSQLRTLVPSELEIDTFQEKAYVGLLPFTLSAVRPVGLPSVPFLSSFHEVNLRTYVHHRGADPGVWFFSLDASSALAVTAARAAYHLNYFHAQVDFTIVDEKRPVIEFHSSRTAADGTPANCHVRYSPEGEIAATAVPGSIEHFLIERYVLYAKSQNRLYRARVHHAPYVVQRAEVEGLEETLVWAAGIRRGESVPLRHYSAGVSVEIFAPEVVEQREG